MAINTNEAHIGTLINTIFTSDAPQAIYGICKLQFCHGEFPGSTSTVISATNILNSGSAPNDNVAFSGTNWSVPSEGVAILASSISGFIKSSGLPVGAAISFIRLLASNGITVLFDIPVDIAKGIDNAVLNKVYGIVAGEQIILKDLRIKIVTKGEFSFNNALAASLIRVITGNPNLNIGYAGALLFGHGYVMSDSGAATASPLIMDIYDGTTIPESANAEPTGTLLWRKSISDAATVMPSIFNVNGTSVSLSSSQSANAVASGVPKYLRIYKNGITTSEGNNYPKLVMQMPIGSGVGYASIDRTTIVSGQSVSVIETSFVIQP